MSSILRRRESKLGSPHANAHFLACTFAVALNIVHNLYFNITITEDGNRKKRKKEKEKINFLVFVFTKSIFADDDRWRVNL